MGKGVVWWLSLSVGTIAQLCLSPAIVSAQLPQATGTPTVYRITFSVTFRNKATQQYVDPAPFDVTELNIAGVNPGDTVSSGGASLPTADYDKAKATINCTAKIQGSVTFSGTTYFTNGGGTFSTTGPAAEGSYSLPGSLCTPPSATFESPDFTPPIHIGGTLTLTFNVANSLWLNGAPGSPVLSPGPFSVSMTVPP